MSGGLQGGAARGLAIIATASLLLTGCVFGRVSLPSATQAPTQQPDTTAPVATGPTQEEAPPPANWPDEPFRGTRPTAGQVAELKLPQVENFKLDNGLDVFLVRNDKLPTVLMKGTLEQPEPAAVFCCVNST